MAIQVQGNSGLVVGSGEEASVPLHVAPFPPSGNWYRVAAFTGTIAAATAANTEIFHFRFVSGSKSFALVYRVIFDGMGVVAVATALGPVGFNMYPARGWTVAGSGGTTISTAGDNLQTETAIASSQVNNLSIATTGALTAGTKTLDANAVGQALGGVLTGAVTTSQALGQVIPQQPLYDAIGAGGQPLVCANNEGFVIRTTHVGPAALTYTAGFTVVWCEVTAF